MDERRLLVTPDDLRTYDYARRVEELHDGAGRIRPPHVVVDRDAVRVDEGVLGSGHVGHWASSPLTA